MKSRIILRYLLFYLSSSFLSFLILFVSLILLGDIFRHLFGFFGQEDTELVNRIKYFLFKIPAIVIVSTPIAFVLSCFWVFGHLTKRGEIQALFYIGGISKASFTLILVIFGIIISSFHLFTSEFVAPYTNKLALKEKKREEERKKIFLSLGENKFLYSQEYNEGKLIKPKLRIFSSCLHLSEYWTADYAEYNIKRGSWRLKNFIWKKLSKLGEIREEKRINEVYLNQLPKPEELTYYIEASEEVKKAPVFLFHRIPMEVNSIADLYYFFSKIKFLSCKDKNKLKVKYYYRLSTIPKYIALSFIIGAIISSCSFISILTSAHFALGFGIIFSFIYFSADAFFLNLAWSTNFYIIWLQVFILFSIGILSLILR